MNLLKAEKLASFEAEINQKSVYLNKLIGNDFFVKLDGASEHKLKDFIDITNYFKDDVKKLLEHYNRKDLCSRSKLLKICNELNECKGSIIGVHQKLLDDIQPDYLKIDQEYKDNLSDDVCAIKIYLPQGLKEEYIQYIYPYGEKEEKLINDHINGNLR